MDGNLKSKIQNQTKQQPSPPDKGLEQMCLIWTGYKDKGGYGRFTVNAKPKGAHVISYMVSNNLSSIPKYNNDGELLQVAHLCDVKACVEPTHLYLATVSQNAEDRIRNGLTRGEKHYNASITEDTAQLIKLSKGNGTQKERALRFNVSLGIIESI